MDTDQNDILIQAMTKLDEATFLLEQLTEGIKLTRITFQRIIKYISGSGNTTWRLAQDKEGGEVIWFRQSQKHLFKEWDIWTALNEIPYEIETSCLIRIHCARDGDFWKPVELDYFDRKIISTAESVEFSDDIEI